MIDRPPSRSFRVFFEILAVLFCIGAAVQAAPTVGNATVAPGAVRPGDKVIVSVPVAEAASGTFSFDLKALGGTSLVLPLSVDVGQASAKGVIPTGLTISGPVDVPYEVTVTGVDGTKTVKLGKAQFQPTTFQPAIMDVTEKSWLPGSEVTVMADSALAKSGVVQVDFRPAAPQTVKIPMVFTNGQAMAKIRVPAKLELSRGSASVFVLLDVADEAGNCSRITKEVSLISNTPARIPFAASAKALPVVAAAAPVASGPVIGTVTVTPAVLVPGGPFSVEVNATGVTQGAVYADFRPNAPNQFRLPLTFAAGVATVTGTVPSSIPVPVNGFAKFTVRVFNAAGDQKAETVRIAPLQANLPTKDLTVTIAQPLDGLITPLGTVAVTGTAGKDITTLTVNGQPATLAAGAFSAQVAIREGRNDIVALGRDGAEGIGSAIVTVRRDTTAPVLSIETPADGAVVTSQQVVVAGLVNDVVSGTVNSEDVTVMVNGVAASVVNRTYDAPRVLLTSGSNNIDVVATDRAGNSKKKSIKVTYRPAAQQQTVLVASGNAQTGIVGYLLTDPLAVEVVDRNGAAIPNAAVTFEVTRGDGKIISYPTEGSKMTVITDTKGQARVFYLLGTRTGQGNNRVSVTSPGFAGQAEFCFSGVVGTPTRIAALLPSFQAGEPGKPLPQRIQALVTDQGGNPMGGIPVRFKVNVGSGKVEGLTEVVVNTNSSGRALATFTLGPETGPNAHQAVASIEGSTVPEVAVFTASAVVPGLEVDTRVVGVVIDSSNSPLEGVTASIEGTSLSAVTDAQGQFIISGAPVGAVRLSVDGRTTSRPGSWPTIPYELVTIAGRDNSPDRPIYMLPIDTPNQKIVGGNQDVTLEMAGIPGAKLTVFANSVTFPGGYKVLPIQWTQVNRDRVPMPPPLGSQFLMTWTLQPAGAKFNPPARVQFPNTGAPPGQQFEIFSFDHDISEFVSMGPGTVSADGSVVVSDVGFGITKSGWGGGTPPPPPSPPCKPWQSDPPKDDDCTRWEKIPADNMCQYDRYKEHKARVDRATATVNGTSSVTVCVGDSVNFDAYGEGRFGNLGFCSVEYHWNFGDGFFGLGAGTSELKSPSYTYTRTGIYTATVGIRCANCDDSKVERSVTVKVIDTAVVQNAVATAEPSQVCVGENTTFGAVADGMDCKTHASVPVTYFWRFSDGSSSATPFVTKSFAAPGTYTGTVYIRCKDVPESEITLTASVTVGDKAIVRNPTASEDKQKICLGQSVLFSASGVGINCATGANAPLKYEWDFGTGNPADATTGSSVSFSGYTKGGIYHASVKISVEGFPTSAVVVNLPPLIVIQIKELEVISFPGSGQLMNDGDGDPSTSVFVAKRLDSKPPIIVRAIFEPPIKSDELPLEFMMQGGVDEGVIGSRTVHSELDAVTEIIATCGPTTAKAKIFVIEATFRESLKAQYGFDDLTNPAIPWKALKNGSSDFVSILVMPDSAELSRYLQFNTKDKLSLASPVSHGQADIEVAAQGVGESSVTLSLANKSDFIFAEIGTASYNPVTKSAIIRVVELPGNTNTITPPDPIVVQTYLRQVFKQRAISFNFAVLPETITLNYDIETADGALTLDNDDEEDIILASRNASYDVNIFIVNKFAKYESGAIAFAHIPGNHIFVDSSVAALTPNLALTIGHEMGHALGLHHVSKKNGTDDDEDHTNDSDFYNLMWYSDQYQGSRLRKSQWDKLSKQ